MLDLSIFPVQATSTKGGGTRRQQSRSRSGNAAFAALMEEYATHYAVQPRHDGFDADTPAGGGRADQADILRYWTAVRALRQQSGPSSGKVPQLHIRQFTDPPDKG